MFGCGSATQQAPLPSPDSSIDDATADTSTADASVDKSKACASIFGDALTNAFGRLDGSILALVPRGHPTCAQPNATHLVLQARGTCVVRGWHESGPLDCVTTLGAKSASFAPHPKDELVATVTNELELGAHGSVFATSSGGTKADSAHLIRRDLTNADGAIVIRPDSASAHYLLFKFSDQVF